MASHNAVAESIDGVAECLSTDRAVLDRVVGELDALRLPVINHRHPSVRVKHFIAKERGGVATEENVQAAHVLREEARLVQRKAEASAWRGTMCNTTQPLHLTPVMYQGRPSLGLEVEIVETAGRWAGTLTVGVTYLPNMNPDRHDLYMDIQDHPSTASRNQYCWEFRNARGQRNRDVKIKPSRPTTSAITHTVAVMIHIDEEPELCAYYNGIRDGHVPSPQLEEALEEMASDCGLGNRSARIAVSSTFSMPFAGRCSGLSVMTSAGTIACLLRSPLK